MPIDFSPLLGPVPESGASQGQRFFADALDAVLQRRQQKQLQEQQMAFQARENLAQRELMGGYYRQLGEDADAQQAETHRANLAREGQAGAQLAATRLKNEQDALIEAQKGAGKGYVDYAQRLEGLYQRPQSQGQPPPPSPQGPVQQPAQPATPAAPTVNMPQPQGPGVVPPAFPHIDDPGYTGGPAAQTPGPAPAPPAPALLPDPAVAVATQQRPPQQGINWAAMTPAVRAAAFRKGMEGIKLPPRVAALIPEVELAVANGHVDPEQALAYFGKERDRIQSGINAALGAERATARMGQTGAHQNRMAARQDLDAYLDNKGYKADQMSLRQFDRMKAVADLALSSKNSMAARMFMGMYTKFAQGEVGVLTQADMDTFWNKAGSPVERTEAALEKILSGGLGEAQAQAARDAILELANTAREREENIFKGASKLMAPYEQDGDRWLRTYFDKGLPQYDAARRAGLSPEERDRLQRLRGGRGGSAPKQTPVRPTAPVKPPKPVPQTPMLTPGERDRLSKPRRATP